MATCHGKHPETDGCCYVNGLPCPLRMYIHPTDGHVYQGPDNTDLGTVAEVIDNEGPGGPAKNTATKLLTGMEGGYLCRAAFDVLTDEPQFLSRIDADKRQAFETRWNIHTGYLANVRPAWEKIETDLGLPAGSYNCSTFQGSPGGDNQCCFSEDPTTNAARVTPLNPDVITMRGLGGT